MQRINDVPVAEEILHDMPVQWVEWVEPGDMPGVTVHFYVGIPQAIQLAKIAAERHDYIYKNDNDALQDFLAVHWAVVKEEK